MSNRLSLSVGTIIQEAFQIAIVKLRHVHEVAAEDKWALMRVTKQVSGVVRDFETARMEQIVAGGEKDAEGKLIMNGNEPKMTDEARAVAVAAIAKFQEQMVELYLDHKIRVPLKFTVARGINPPTTAELEALVNAGIISDPTEPAVTVADEPAPAAVEAKA